MKILDIITSPWAIRPERMAEVRNIYRSHIGGPKIDWKGMEERVGIQMSARPGEGDDCYQMINGVAVIPVKGVLSKESSFISWLFGGASMKEIAASFQKALDDPLCKSIVLDVDSPGGTVDGTEELAALIFQSRGRKPITAYTDGMMCSGAYWISSAADEIYISGDTVEVGSIGVMATHIDQSKWDEMMGDSFTEIAAGRFKGIFSSHKPLSSEGESYIQEQVDYLYDVFRGCVGKYRGADEKAVLAMADGKVFIGKQAMEIGLVDGVSTFSDLMEKAAGVAANSGKYYAKGDNEMTLEELKQKHPDLYAAVMAEGKAIGIAEGAETGKRAGLEEGRAQGAASERKRIADVKAQFIPGHEALIESLVADGQTTGPEAAVKVLAAEKALREGKKQAFDQDGKDISVQDGGVGFVPPARSETAGNMKEAGEKLDRFAQEIKDKEKCTYSEAMVKAKAAHPALAKIYEGRE